MTDFLQAGDIIELTAEHTVRADIPAHFCFINRKGDWSITRHAADLSQEHFEYLRGQYVVIKTSHDGGGRGHFQGDEYSNGHHVFCTKMVKEIDAEIEIDFYQSGPFEVKIEPKDIEVIGKAKLTWSRK